MDDHNLLLPETLDSTLVIDDAIRVRKDRLRYHQTHIEDYYIVSSSEESVSIVALSPTNEILVTREYRHPTKKVVLGFPGGLVNRGEPVLDAAKRELLEETGCVATSFQVIGSCYPLPGVLAQKMHVVLALGVEVKQPPLLEITEAIQSSFMKREELDLRLKSGADVDGVLCTALHYLALYAIK